MTVSVVTSWVWHHSHDDVTNRRAAGTFLQVP